MHFTRLHLQGFKSFVDPTDLIIQPGTTGIVGPNGCGKSNLVEALRWVMGETSPKRMRGAEMDDVIFAGTATRPSRNLAEVTLALDNTNRSAIAEHNSADEIIVARKIERGSGSDFRINGKPVRLRDVQLLFADQATGAHSTSVVGQGQIDALIRAKPQDRRQILEEASGTAGLQARRHEAELKLKAADQNLTRVDDVLRTLDTQLRSLKQQVRQASRYRNLAEHIRRTEAALLHLRWVEAEENHAKTLEALQEAEKCANDLLSVVTQGNTARATIAAELPGLRKTEAAAAALVQKLTLAREQIEAETQRVADEIQAQEQRLTQAQSDSEREQARHRDGEAASARLDAEQTQLTEKEAEIIAALPGVTEALAAATAEVEAFDAELAKLMESAAVTEARQQSLQQEIENLTQKQATLIARREQLDTERTVLAAEIAARPDVSLAASVVIARETELAKCQQQAQDAEQACRDADRAQNAKRDAAQQVQSKLTKLKAEADAIAAFLQHQENDAKQVIDIIAVTPGLENALAVALGEALTATLDPQAAVHWRALPPLKSPPELPKGAVSLNQYIQAPPALARSLSQIGLVDTGAIGEPLASSLLPGQTLVSRDGWAWRWDGFTVTPEAKTTTAMRLQQRNRLAALQTEIAKADSEAQDSERALIESSAILQQCQTLDQQARALLQSAFSALNDAREHHARQERDAAAANVKLTALSESSRQIALEMDQIGLRARAIENERAALPYIEALRADIARKRIGLAEVRSKQAQQQSERDRLTREQQTSAERRQAVLLEKTAWMERMKEASAQSVALANRITAIESRLVELRAKPEELAAKRNGLLSELSAAEDVRRVAADALIGTEQKLSVTEHQLKQDEAALSEAREERVRAEAAVQASTAHFDTLRERMMEKLNATPENVREIAAFGDGESWPSAFELEQALGRYLRERDNMGPVNLRAEVEAESTQASIDKLQQDKNDLVAAIAKLRQGISQLNREARERLQDSFVLVNERFQVLFKRLFDGGKAHLELIDNEDPLNAGLEIFASPPGKKLQILSLLSGGEQTLTALALLFAVFQTNPSPICVLDEAEASLDETNIDQFCALIDDIAKETGTRFLIITHQRLTMARMDRLFGVTMSEKGVSQLVSVDLAGAVALRDGEMPDAFSTAADALAEVRAA
jgi:chromosome segregation protein